MALTLEDINLKLDKAGHDIVKRLKLDINLKTRLVKEGVIGDELREVINNPLRTRHEQVHSLIEDLRYGPVTRFLNFSKAVSADGQPEVLDALAVNISDVLRQLGIDSHASSNGNTDGTPVFTAQQKFYIDKLAKIPLYEYVMRSASCPIEDVFTNLELVDNKDDRDRSRVLLEKHHNPRKERLNTQVLHLHNLFDDMDNKLLQIILEGAAGIGKTSLMKYCAVEWAKAKSTGRKYDVALRGKPEDFQSFIEYFVSQIELLIYVDKSNEGEDLDSSIQNALKGSPEERNKAFKFWSENRNKCFLFLDGLDEFINKGVVTDIIALASWDTTNMLVSCRPQHPYLEKDIKYFNRSVKITGFTRCNAIDFVKVFAQKLPDYSEEKAATLCEFLSEEKVPQFYRNPMNCAFVCLLFINGDIAEDELKSMKMADLLRKQETCLLKRECIKLTNSQAEADELEEQSQATVKAIHRMAICYVLGRANYMFKAKDLENFGIEIKSPAMVLLQEDTEMVSKTYTWPHRLICEFHATCAIQQNELIMYKIASDPSLNTIGMTFSEGTRYLLSFLIEFDFYLSVRFFTTFLLMQSKGNHSAHAKDQSANTVYAHSDIRKVQNALKGCYFDNFPSWISKEIPFTMRCREIQKCLQHGDWALLNYRDLMVTMLFMFEICTREDQYQELLKEVIHPFMSSIYSGNLLSLSRRCDLFKDYGNGWLQRTLAWNTYIDCEVHPIEGNIPFYILQHNQLSFTGRMTAMLLFDNSQKASVTNIVISKPNDLLDQRGKLETFADKIPRPDVVHIELNNGLWSWQFSVGQENLENSDIWAEAILIVQEVFKPKKSIVTCPEYWVVLTDCDQRELKANGVKLAEP